MRTLPHWLIIASVVVVLLVIAFLLGPRPDAPEPLSETRPVGAQRVPELPADAKWLGGGPLTADSLAGHPLVFVVWSDTDPRSLALLPVADGWQRAYGRYGLRVVGVHTPDFSFAADPAVAEDVRRRLGLTFPIVVDPGYAIERSLETTERPALVVADGRGNVRLVAGPKGTAEVDRMLRDLVRAANPKTVFPDGPGGWTGPPVSELNPKFVFLGTARASAGPLADATPGRAQTFTAQFRFQEEGDPFVPYPVGRWTPSAEGLTAERGGAAEFVALRTEGGTVDVVVGPPPGGKPARVWVLGDEEWLAPGRRGEDVRVDARGATYLDVDAPRLYSLARGPVRVLKLSPDMPGVTFYCFTIEK